MKPITGMGGANELAVHVSAPVWPALLAQQNFTSVEAGIEGERGFI